MDHDSEITITAKKSSGNNSAVLNVILLFLAESKEYNTNNTMAILLYAYPSGNVIRTAEMKKISGFLPSGTPILFSKAVLEKL